MWNKENSRAFENEVSIDRLKVSLLHTLHFRCTVGAVFDNSFLELLNSLVLGFALFVEYTFSVHMLLTWYGAFC